MTHIIHLIGPQGSGKSTFAHHLALGLSVRGQRTAVVHWEAALHLHETIERIDCAYAGYDLLIVEADEVMEWHRNLRPGDRILSIGDLDEQRETWGAEFS